MNARSGSWISEHSWRYDCLCAPKCGCGHDRCRRAPCDNADSHEARKRFLLGLDFGATLFSGSATALNVLADPYRYAGTSCSRPRSSRTAHQGVSRGATPARPNLAILGSPRAEKAQATYWRRRTRLSGLNAAVSSATPDDAWAFANPLQERAAGTTQRVVWFLDIESMRAHPIDPGCWTRPRWRST